MKVLYMSEITILF